MTAKCPSVPSWIFLLIIFRLAASIFAINLPASAAVPQKKNVKPPITFEQVEKTFSKKLENKIEAKLVDETLAGEIQRRGIAFKFDKKIGECLKERLYAGPQTIRALEEAARKKGNQSLPRPMMVCDKKTILIADFQSLDGPNEKKYPISKIILSQLKDAMKYPDTVIQSLGEEITVDQGSEVAREKAKQNKASIILWGTYSVTKENVLVKVYFELISDPFNIAFDKGSKVLLEEKKMVIAPVADLLSFSLEMRLSKEMSYLILLTSGLARFEAEDYKGAVERFTNALDKAVMPETMIDPSAIYFYRAMACGMTEEWDQAIADFTKVIGFKPGLARAYLYRSIAYMGKRELELAIADCTKVIEFKLDSTDTNKVTEFKRDLAEAYYNRATVYILKREWDNAIKDYTMTIELPHRFPEMAYRGRALAHLINKNWDGAIADCLKAIELKYEPEAQAHAICAEAYGNKDERDKAIEHWTKVIELAPDFERAYALRAIAYKEKEEWNKAIRDYSKVIELAPNLAEAHFERAACYQAKGEEEQALKGYTRAIELKPDLTSAYFGRALIYGHKKEWKLAIADFFPHSSASGPVNVKQAQHGKYCG